MTRTIPITFYSFLQAWRDWRASRPMRWKACGDNIYACLTRTGLFNISKVRNEWVVRLNGVRMSAYRDFDSAKDGAKYLNQFMRKD